MYIGTPRSTTRDIVREEIDHVESIETLQLSVGACTSVPSIMQREVVAAVLAMRQQQHPYSVFSP